MSEIYFCRKATYFKEYDKWSKILKNHKIKETFYVLIYKKNMVSKIYKNYCEARVDFF